MSIIFFTGCGKLSTVNLSDPTTEELAPDDNDNVSIPEVPREVERTFKVEYPWGLRDGLIYENGSAEIIHCGSLSEEEKIHIAELLDEGLQDYILEIERSDPLSTTASTIVEDDCLKKEVLIREGLYETRDLEDIRGHRIESIVNCVHTDGTTLDEDGPYFLIQSTCALLKK